MKHSEISSSFTEIKGLIIKGKTHAALLALEQFISSLNDETLENQIVSLLSRYNRFNREKIQGTINEENKIELNAIEASLMQLLREARQVAIEEAAVSVGAQLSELAQDGENAIDELKKLTYIMAESRLLELKVFRSYLGSFFSKKDVENFDNSIHALRKVLGKEEKEEESPELFAEDSEIISNIQENLSPRDMINLMNKFFGGRDQPGSKQESEEK